MGYLRSPLLLLGLALIPAGAFIADRGTRIPAAFLGVIISAIGLVLLTAALIRRRLHRESK